MFFRNKSIKMFLNFKQYESIILNIAFSSEKATLSESGEKYAKIKHRLQAKMVQNSCKQICWRIIMWENEMGWKKRYYESWTCILSRNNGLS